MRIFQGLTPSGEARNVPVPSRCRKISRLPVRIYRSDRSDLTYPTDVEFKEYDFVFFFFISSSPGR
ncbi:MAG: hypothetical protein WCO98_08930 [bacterium]